MPRFVLIPKLLLTAILFTSTLFAGAGNAIAQPVPVQVNVSGNTATAQIGGLGGPIADLTLTFDDASGLSASSLGLNAELVSLSNPSLLSRLPNLQLTQLDSSLPLLITVEPPATASLSFKRTVRVEVHTHLLTYAAGSPYRLFKAPLGGAFRDITDEIAPGSVRARGTTGGFSQFLVLVDLRDTGTVVAQKFAWLRAHVATLPAGLRAPYDAGLDAAEAAVGNGNYTDATAELDTLHAEASAQAGNGLAEQWQAGGGAVNEAGELIAGLSTLKYSIAYLRDYGP